MSTQNLLQYRAIFTDLPVATYYCPVVTGVAVQSFFTVTTANAYFTCDGYDNLSIMFRLVAGANNTLTLTVESDDGVTTTFEWDETPGCYNSLTNAFAANYVAAAATVRGHLHLDDCNGRRFHAELIVANAGVLSNSGILIFRATKV